MVEAHVSVCRCSAISMGEPLLARIARRADSGWPASGVRCGGSGCDAFVAEIFPWVLGRTHGVRWRYGFCRCKCSVWRLTNHFLWEWTLMRRQGVQWNPLLFRRRKPEGYPRKHLAGDAFEFSCPVCGRISLAEVPRECNDECGLCGIPNWLT